MSGETLITVVGNLTADPELRFTPSGSAVANFTIASTPRTFDRTTNEWKDAETLFMRCSVWREPAENVAESLVKGTRVMAQGFLKQRSYDTKEGEKRTVMELDVQEVGPSLRYASAQVTRKQGNGGQGGSGYQNGGQPQGGDQQGWGGQPQGGGFGGGQQGWGAPQGAPQGGFGGQPQGQPAGAPQGQQQGWGAPQGQQAQQGWGNPGQQQQGTNEPPF